MRVRNRHLVTDGQRVPRHQRIGDRDLDRSDGSRRRVSHHQRLHNGVRHSGDIVSQLKWRHGGEDAALVVPGLGRQAAKQLRLGRLQMHEVPVRGAQAGA